MFRQALNPGKFISEMIAGCGGGKASFQQFAGSRRMAFALLTLCGLLFGPNTFAVGNGSWSFAVRLDRKITTAPQTGRMIIILSREEKPEPRLIVTRTGNDAPCVLACDVDAFTTAATATLTDHSIMCPSNGLASLPEGNYFVQALLDCNSGTCVPNRPGNLYSDVQRVHVEAGRDQAVQLILNHQVPDEVVPADTSEVKFVNIKSRLLSQFYGRPFYLRAGVILPREYDRESTRRYPLWVRIGGYGTRYTVVSSLMGKNSGFRRVWLADGTPRMILLQLDGDGPYGDPFQVNSANCGPFGDAVTKELIPAVESQFRAVGGAQGRVLSGLSTGGWAALGLQVFYPDFFNGVWCFCPDPVDFRAFELINLYADDNAYVNRYGFERPSERSVDGEVRLTVRRELQIENVLGHGNSWTESGCDWCAWNAVFGPRMADGRPAVPWDPISGAIHHDITAQWKNHDLRLVMEQNWPSLGPKLQGKLHIAVGDADNYYLNNAVHLLDDFLSQANPPYQGTVVFGPRKGHGWADVDLATMLRQMAKAASTAR